jgi:hypothetical protein
LASPRRSVGIAQADRADQRECPLRAGAGQRHQQVQIEFLGRDRPHEHDPRLGQRSQGRIDRSREQCAGKVAGVGHVGRVQDAPRHRPHPIGQRGRAGDHQIGARGEPPLGGEKAVRVDSLLGGDVVDAVVDHQLRRQRLEQHFGLRDVAPENGPA